MARRLAGKAEPAPSSITHCRRRSMDRPASRKSCGTAAITAAVAFLSRMEARRLSLWYLFSSFVFSTINPNQQYLLSTSFLLTFALSSPNPRYQITNKTGGDAVHLDMTPNTFAQLADKSLGEIDIEWEHVACPITTPLQIRMHAGASQYWFAATVENAVLRTAGLDVSTDSGSTWRSTTRNTNNFFELSSASGTSTVWTRATSELGDQVVVKNVVLTAGTTTTGTSNYPSS